MTTEQQLIEALDEARGYAPSDDLWSRVLHSIEDDRAHRRRLWMAAAWIGAALVLAITLISLNVDTNLGGSKRIDWRVLEALEAGILVTLVAVLGPAIRRFGRGYVEDIFVTSHDAGDKFLKLLDVAYYLLFAGFIMVTTRLSAPLSYDLFDAADQLEDALVRIGGLLIIMGLLHAATLMATPLVGLVFNSTVMERKLPRWVTLLLVLAAGPIGFALMMAASAVMGGVE